MFNFDAIGESKSEKVVFIGYWLSAFSMEEMGERKIGKKSKTAGIMMIRTAGDELNKKTGINMTKEEI